MTWMVVLQIAVLMIVGTFCWGIAFSAYQEIKREKNNEFLMRVESAMTQRIIPTLVANELDMTEKIMDKICEKIPDMMVKTMESTKKIMEEME